MDDNSNAINKVCVYGVGGVGGYFGGKITDVNRIKDAKHEVYFIARGKHLDAIKRRWNKSRYSGEDHYRSADHGH